MTNPSNQVAWHGAGHPAESEPCPACNANPGAPCTSTVGLTPHGATGTPIRGLHAARVDAARKANEPATVTEPAGCAVYRRVMEVAS